MTIYSDLPWLSAPARRLAERLARARVPQALLIHGPAGVGRRHLAVWFAATLLDSGWSPPPDVDADDLPPVPHADFLQLGIEEDKKSIGVDQLRGLIEFLGFTSHGGGRKVALVYPAEGLQRAAANSLLKTLEEPPGPSTLILVCEAPARLPATLLSRCERIRLVPPTPAQGLAWLQAIPAPPGALEEALAFAGGAPLAARSLLNDGFAKVAGALSEDLDQLVRREVAPTTIARRWAKLDVRLCHRWLYWQVAALLRTALAPGADNAEYPKLPLKIPGGQLNMQACCAYLDRLNQARRLEDRSLNTELQFAELLMWWYGGLGAAG